MRLVLLSVSKNLGIFKETLTHRMGGGDRFRSSLVMQLPLKFSRRTARKNQTDADAGKNR